MPNLNKVMVMGNLTRDPELRHTPKGTAVLDITLAVNRYFSSDDGQRREETTFIDITLWARQAEVVHQYCGKGRPLFVEGRLQMDSWEDRTTGQQRTKLKVVGEKIEFLGSRDGGGGGGGSYQSQQQQQQYSPAQQQQAPSYQPPPQSQPSQPSPAPSPASPPSDEEDDIPF